MRGEQDDGNIFLQAVCHGWRGDSAVAEDEDLVDLGSRYFQQNLSFFLHDQSLVIACQHTALFLDIERASERHLDATGWGIV